MVSNKIKNMKQLIPLFLFLLPCFALAQYPSNGNQKITLGEQTTADGLIWRGVASTDTVRKPSVDTMAYMILDTTTNIIWHYKKATSNAWLRLNLLPSDTASMLTNYWRSGRFSGTLPVANGGTGNSTTYLIGSIPYSNGTSLISDTSKLFFDNTNNRLSVGTRNPVSKLSVYAATGGVTTGINISGSNNIFNMFGSSTPALGVIFDATWETVGSATGVPLIYRIGGTERMRIDTDGDLGIGSNTPSEKLHVVGNGRFTGNIAAGVTSATARLHLAAGSSTASTAPLKFTSGTNLTTAEAGAMEFNGTNLLFSPSTVRHTVNHGLTGSANLDFPSTLTLLSADRTISVTGAADGDVVSLGVPNAAVNANTNYSAWVSSANTVTVRFNNYSSAAVDPASGLFKVFVTK
jgi:hypothetical protein